MQKQIHVRAKHERAGALALAAMTILGSAAVAKVSRNFYKEVTTNPAFAFSQITERENETGRIPVRFDIGINNPSKGGL
jgi:hypothetical protein